VVTADASCDDQVGAEANCVLGSTSSDLNSLKHPQPTGRPKWTISEFLHSKGLPDACAAFAAFSQTRKPIHKSQFVETRQILCGAALDFPRRGAWIAVLAESFAVAVLNRKVGANSLSTERRSGGDDWPFK